MFLSTLYWYWTRGREDENLSLEDWFKQVIEAGVEESYQDEDGGDHHYRLRLLNPFSLEAKLHLMMDDEPITGDELCMLREWLTKTGRLHQTPPDVPKKLSKVRKCLFDGYLRSHPQINQLERVSWVIDPLVEVTPEFKIALEMMVRRLIYTLRKEVLMVAISAEDGESFALFHTSAGLHRIFWKDYYDKEPWQEVVTCLIYHRGIDCRLYEVGYDAQQDLDLIDRELALHGSKGQDVVIYQLNKKQLWCELNQWGYIKQSWWTDHPQLNHHKQIRAF